MRFTGRISLEIPSVFLSKHPLVSRTIGVVSLVAMVAACVQMRSSVQRPSIAIVEPGEVATPIGALRGSVQMTVLGDSLAYGAGATSVRNGFAHLIFDYVHGKRPGSSLANLAFPYATTRQVIEHQLPRLLPSESPLILIVTGSNDVQHYGRVGPFARHYADLLIAIRERAPSAVIVVAGLLDVSLAPAVPRVAKPLIAAFSAMSNAEIARLAPLHRAAVIDYFSFSHRVKARLASLMSADGWHPTDAGHELMAQTAFPLIDTLLG